MAFPLDAAAAEVIDQIFNTRAELLYAGGQGEGRGKAAAARAEIVSALERLGKAHGRN
jgi:Flp pilus assembly CpaF family ATPase